jgi:hypothetical protein
MKRRYFFIDLPNANVSHSLNVRVGKVKSDTYSLDGTVLFVKTTNQLIANSSENFNTIFPPAFTTEVTLEEAKTRLRSSEFSEEEL